MPRRTVCKHPLCIKGRVNVIIDKPIQVFMTDGPELWYAAQNHGLNDLVPLFVG